MKIFIIGFPESGSDKVAESLAQDPSLHFISAADWLRSTFRPIRQAESKVNYEQEYFEFIVHRMKVNPNICIDNINQIISLVSELCPHKSVIINGIVSPGDFTALFNYNTDMVVFLNRIDTEYNPRDHEGVAINVIRDYCLYLSALGLITRNQWLEYNYKIPGEDIEFTKQLGKHNTVTITKSLNKAIEHLKGEVCKALQQKE